MSYDGFDVTDDPQKIGAANLAQWFVSASMRRMPGTPLYRASSVIAYTLREMRRNDADVMRRRNPPAPLTSSDLRAAAKMLGHVRCLYAAGLPADILVVTDRLNRGSMHWTGDPNDDWDGDHTEVQIIVANTGRIAPLVAKWLQRHGMQHSSPWPGHCGYCLAVRPNDQLIGDNGRSYHFRHGRQSVFGGDGYWYCDDDSKTSGWSAAQIIGGRADTVRRQCI